MGGDSKLGGLAGAKSWDKYLSVRFYSIAVPKAGKPKLNEVQQNAYQ
jgi:hypothetical protein